MNAKDARAALLALCLVPLPALAADGMLFERPDVFGAVRVIDGDTLAIGDARVRLAGIDAPEIAEPGGAVAMGLLNLIAAMADGVLCVGADPDRWGRVVARCFALPGGIDLSTEMVARGYARSDVRFSAGRPEAEAAARAAQAGLWACTTEAPVTWPKPCQ